LNGVHILCARDIFSQEHPNLTIAGTAVLLACAGVAAMFVDALKAELLAPGARQPD
jgi:hypothetical protein